MKKFYMGAGALLASGMASAAPDLTAITEAGTTVAAIGAAVFAVHVGIKVWKWAKSAT